MSFEINYKKDYNEKLNYYNEKLVSMKWITVIVVNIAALLLMSFIVEYDFLDLQELGFESESVNFIYYGSILILGLIVSPRKFDNMMAVHKKIEKEYNTATSIKLKNYITQENLGEHYNYIANFLKKEYSERGFISLYTMFSIMSLMDKKGTLSNKNFDNINEIDNKEFLENL